MILERFIIEKYYTSTIPIEIVDNLDSCNVQRMM